MSEPVRFEAEQHRWEVDPGHEAFVRATLAPCAAGPETLPGAEVIKQNRIRTVARIAGPEGQLFCKRFRVLRPFQRLLHLVKPSSARREYAALRRLREAGLSCPEPVILGEAHQGGLLVGSVLATREAAGAIDLSNHLDALRAQGATDARRILVDALAEVIWRIFRAGGNHPDLHVGNFLVRPRGGLVVLDLHSVRLQGSPLAAWLRRRRLGKLAHSFGPTNPLTEVAAHEEIAWFARAYAAFDPALGPAGRLRARMLAMAERLEAARLRSRDRRCLMNSTTFARSRRGTTRIFRRREVSEEAVLAACAAEPLAAVHVHPRGRSRIDVVPAPPGFGEARQLIRKRYLFPRFRKRLAGVWNPLPLRAWKAARACEIRFVPTPHTYALVLEGWPLPRHAAILMELLADVSMIHVLLETTPPLSPASRRRLARDFGSTMGRFHASGLKHRDLAVQNILVRPREGDGRAGWDVWVIDLDEVRAAPMSRKEKLRALIHMADLPEAATRSDRLRFFRAYLAAGGRRVLAEELAAVGERGLGREVAEGLARRAAAKARRQARKVAQPKPTDLSALAGER